MAGKGVLAGLDLGLKLTREEEAARLIAAQDRLLQLRLVLGGQIGDHPQIGPPVCVVFEGWDASGKGGAIKRLVAPLDPRHVRVAQFGAPTYDEKRHHFLWRFWPVLPGWGGMAVLDRSWYGRVLVERVEGYATEEQWRRAYREIVDFERTLSDEGMIFVKFWLHLSPAEQLKRFKARERDPLKVWKLTEEDWRNREKRPEYEAAVEDMLNRTDHPGAPWVLVEAEDKRWARVKVVESVVAAIEAGLATRNLPVPPVPHVVARIGLADTGRLDAQSRSNSLPSMSCITMHDSLSSSAGSSRTRTAPSATSRVHSASSVARRSAPTSPVPTRTSRCTRFLTTLPSGTRWKNSRGPLPEGSTHANHEP
jgi:polyphosphate kinase 2 (PPK2 family)